MANRNTMQTIGGASSRNQAFYQGPILQGARATTQARVNQGGSANPYGAGLGIGQVGIHPYHMPSPGDADFNPITGELRGTRALGIAQQASYGPAGDNQANNPTYNPITPAYGNGTFHGVNPITGRVAGGSNAHFGTERTPTAPAAPVAPAAPPVPTSYTPPPPISDPSPISGDNPINQPGGSNYGFTGPGMVAAPTDAPGTPPSQQVGDIDFDHSAISPNFKGTTVGGKYTEVGSMTNRDIKAYLLMHPEMLAPGWIIVGDQILRGTAPTAPASPIPGGTATGVPVNQVPAGYVSTPSGIVPISQAPVIAPPTPAPVVHTPAPATPNGVRDVVGSAFQGTTINGKYTAKSAMTDAQLKTYLLAHPEMLKAGWGVVNGQILWQG